MPKLIKGNTVIDNTWVFIDNDHEGALPEGNLLLPLASWLGLGSETRSNGNTAPWINADEEFGDSIAELLTAPLIAINFPTFMDGRGFSSAEILRQQYGYQGELRAIGNLIQDQLFFLKRCGFDSYQLREGTNLEKAVASLNDFSTNYQTSADTDKPLFRTR